MEHYPKYQYIAIISGILLILSFYHLVYNVYITKQTDNFTFTWLFLSISSQVLLMIYGILNNSYGIYLPRIFILFCFLYILYVKLTYKKGVDVESELKKRNII